MERTRLSIYRDLIPPIVEVSADGSLGWVIAQVEGQGDQTTADGRERQKARKTSGQSNVGCLLGVLSNRHVLPKWTIGGAEWVRGSAMIRRY